MGKGSAAGTAVRPDPHRRRRAAWMLLRGGALLLACTLLGLLLPALPPGPCWALCLLLLLRR